MYRYYLLVVVICINIKCFTQVDDKSFVAEAGGIKSIHERVFSTSSESESGEMLILKDVVHTYNYLGFKTETVKYRNDSIFSIVRYKLLNDSILLESNEYNPDGSLYLKIKYTTNEYGYIEKAVFYRESQKAYDDERQRIDIEYEKYYSGLYTTIDYVTDFKGNILSSKYTTQNGSLYCRYQYNYDYMYKRVQTKYYNNKNKLSWRKKIKYDRDGLVSEIKLYESNRIARVSEFSYKTDAKANWIDRTEKRQLFDNFFAYYLDDNTIITKRIIEYYE